jgi:hypothetical protein
MLAELIEPTDPRWRQLLAATDHDVYHLPGYGPLYEPRAREQALLVRGQNAELLLPLMIRPMPELGQPLLSGWCDASSPYGYPGPLVRGTFLSSELERLPDIVFRTLQQHRVLTCFVRCNPLIPAADALVEKLGAAVVHGETAIMELESNGQEIWAGIEQTHRRHIDRLKAKGFESRIGHWGDLKSFKLLYAETMGRVGASAFYLFDDAYFDGLRSLLGEQLEVAAVISPEGDVASAGLYTMCNGIVNAHLSASARSHLPLAPSKLLFDAVWRWAKRRGEKLINLGGGLGGQNDSLFRFKKGFASTTKPFRTVRIVCDPALHLKACLSAGVSPDDVTGFFPGYRRPAANPELRP